MKHYAAVRKSDGVMQYTTTTDDFCIPVDMQFDFIQTDELLTGDWRLNGDGELMEYTQSPSLEQMKVAKQVEIAQAFEAAASALTTDYPPSERLTWPIQQAEALAWGADTSTPTPFLDGVAMARGIDPFAMRMKAYDAVVAFMAASQWLIGKRQALRDAVTVADTPELVAAIVWPQD